MRIVEVAPRDGLQNEKARISTEAKCEFIKALSSAGLKEIEATSFVSPNWIPQLGDAEELMSLLPDGPAYSALVPNLKGLDRALTTKLERIAVFTAASDAFTQKNLNMSVDASLAGFKEVIGAFRSSRPAGWIRGYVSTAFECPYAGKIDPKSTTSVASRLIELGVDEVSIGDTIGVAVPAEVRTLTKQLLDSMSADRIAYHFHDTRGTAVANVAEALSLGIRAFDASAGGLGGCPYAPGAGGNLATEDLVYFLERSGIKTGVDLDALARCSLPVLNLLGKTPTAKAQLAALAS